MNDKIFESVLENFEIFFINKKLELSRIQKSNKNLTFEYNLANFQIKLENYHKEIYLIISKNNDTENEINLFNLLEFLYQENKNKPESNYYKNEENLEQCLKKQIFYLSEILYNNLTLIKDFFKEVNYKTNIEKFNTFWKSSHSDLY
jgi:hypothetical protein